MIHLAFPLQKLRYKAKDISISRQMVMFCHFHSLVYPRSHWSVYIVEFVGKTVTSRSSDSGAASFVNFQLVAFSYLNITVIGTDLMDDENQCGFACLESRSCFSYNVAAFPDINKRFLCELLPSDKYNNSEEFVQHNLYHHFSIAVSKSLSCKLRATNSKSLQGFVVIHLLRIPIVLALRSLTN